MEHSPIQIPPPEALAGVPESVIADAIERLILALDMRNGDPDLEANGDELDGGNAEDKHLFGSGHGPRGRAFDGGPGCEVSDVGEYAYPEWHTLGRHKAAPYRGSLPHEDAEDDDPDQGGDEGEPDFSDPLARAALRCAR